MMESGQTQVRENQAIDATAKTPAGEYLPQSNHASDPDDDLDDLDGAFRLGATGDHNADY